MADENLLLYVNLAGELFYIVAHRIKSQRVKVELAQKVFNDLGVAICSPSRIQALLSGDLCLVAMKFDTVKMLMDQIAHCSIMSVNEYSLEKLFELTMIATKYQFTMCQHPRDILLIVLNHLDNLRRVLTDLNASRLAQDLHNILIISYGRANVAEMRNYLNSIRNYVQEVRLKMTNLIKMGLQTLTGEFITKYPPDFWIHPDCVKPGEIESRKKGRFGQKAKKFLITFDAQNSNATHRLPHSLSLNGSRVIFLGNSIYDREGPSIDYDDHQNEGEDSWGNPVQDPDQQQRNLQTKQPSKAMMESLAQLPEQDEDENDFLDVYQAVQGLDLCSQLLGCQVTTSEEGHTPNSRSFFPLFQPDTLQEEQDEESLSRMNNEENNEEEDNKNNKSSRGRKTRGHNGGGGDDELMSGVNIVKIDARSANLASLAEIAKQFDVDQDEEDCKQDNEDKTTEDGEDEDDENNMFSDR